MTPPARTPAHSRATGPVATPPPGSIVDDDQVTAWALAARDGDSAAVDRFVRATYGDVRRFVAHLSGDPRRAEDLAQDTYLRALRSLPAFAGRCGARSWLLTIARRSVIDNWRRASARPALADTDWSAALESHPRAPAPAFDEALALRRLLDSLALPRKEAFVLTQLLDLSYEETALVLNCPVGTVRSRVARARAELVALLRAAEGTAEEPAA